MTERENFDRWFHAESIKYVKAHDHSGLVSFASKEEILWLGWQARAEQQKARTA